MTLHATDTLLAAAHTALRLIPPAWPLAATVAVNPFLGHTGDTLADAQQRLGRAGGLRLTMPRAWYAAKIATGEITDEDLAAALTPIAGGPDTPALLRAAATREAPVSVALPTVASIAVTATGVDLPAIVADRIGVWAAAHFDEGQAHWTAARGGNVGENGSAWTAWLSFATHDLTPEILGISGFAAHAATAPQRAEDAITRAAGQLGIGELAFTSYCHTLLMSLGGWAQIARWRLWQAEMAGGTDATLRDLLAIALTFEAAIHGVHGKRLTAEWTDARERHAAPLAPSQEDAVDAALQEAAERAHQRKLAQLLTSSASIPVAATASAPANRPTIQAAFCIDVRSEVYRRALENVSGEVETIGFAGFFGLPLAHRRFGSCLTEPHLPVLLAPGVKTCVAVTPELEAEEERQRIMARARRAWGRFRQAAVSSFAFVEAAGPLYAGKLVAASLALAPKAPTPDPRPELDPDIPIETRVAIAKTVLGAMSMTAVSTPAGFARIVLLVGHGAQVTNNPHASALHCGACGGQTGEVSARTLAALLNEPGVRQGLAASGIVIPEDTLFLGGLHDTTTDQVTLYDVDHPSPALAGDLAKLRKWLDAAGKAARTEREAKLSAPSTLPLMTGAADVVQRAHDWSQVRPEWGLAGCSAFIAAPRSRTAGRSLEGRTFLHSYDWRADEGFGVLELILTAPVVVASWISLQYYGSTVAPAAFGGGNKLLHNVVGGIGVLEGNGGAPRVGLPWQSIHDGERLMHEPFRLSVLIEAPRTAISAVLAKHPNVRELFDNRWLHLFALDEAGQMAWRYTAGNEWQAA